MEVQLKDNARLVTRTVTDEGYMQAQAAVTRATVNDYRRGELGLDGDPEERVRVYRASDSVFHDETKGSLAHKPILLNQHSMQDADTVRGQMVGVTGADAKQDGNALLANVHVYDRAAVKQIEGGSDEVSLGYMAELKEERGAFEGRAYDYVTDGPLRVNHLSLVRQGRLGQGARILDSNTTATPDTSGLETRLADSVKDLAKAQTELADTQAKLADAEKERDEAKDALGKAEAAFADRIGLVWKLRPLLGDDAKADELAKMDEEAILRAALGDKAPDGKPAGYLLAMADAKLDALAGDADKRQKAAKQFDKPATVADAQVTDATSAYAKYEGLMVTAYQRPISHTEQGA